MNVQIVINILISTSIYLLVALSFSVFYQPTKFFNLTHAFVLSIGAYLVYSFNHIFSSFISLPLALILTVIIGISSEVLIFKPLRKRNSYSFIMLIASLGLYVCLQNVISLIWGDDTKSLRIGDIKAGHDLLGAYITDIQLITIAVSLLLFIGTIILQNKT